MCAFHSQIPIHLSDSFSVGVAISERTLLEKEWYRYGIDHGIDNFNMLWNLKTDTFEF